MKKSTVYYRALLLSFVLLTLHCAKLPQAELQQAQKALDEATNAGAQQWAPQYYQSAKDKMDWALALIRTKKYKQAKPALKEVVSLAQVAKKEALAAQKAEQEKVKAKEKATPTIKMSHTVVSGEYLWKISARSDMYGNGHRWYDIYKANQAQIDKNYKRYSDRIGQAEKKFSHPAQLIYPGQVFNIPR
jgi:nucleoid-associated protein YgaU